ncbi:MAG: FecR domain-containing protein [Chloroflexi bacterium]|nr:FecR domain-containing protein [Chloroflexota bacterium]
MILSGCQADNADSALTASLSELEGMVGIKSPENADFSPAAADAVLTDQGQIRTGGDGRARLDLSNGAVIRVSPVSFFELVVSVDGHQAPQIKLEAGRIFVILGSASQGMDVETPSGVATVRGSFMMVEVNPIARDVGVTCLEGHCEASNPAGKAQFTAGEKSMLLHRDPATGEYSAPGVQPMEKGDYDLWLAESPEALALAQHGLASLSESPAATFTPTKQPASTSSETPAASPTVGTTVAGEGLGPCISLVSPAEGAIVDHNNPVNFQWTSRVEAAQYVLKLSYPDGTTVSFETTETQIARYFDSLLSAVNFSWEVAALDADGNTMCISPTGTFIKPEPQPTRQKESILPTPTRIR